jgi:hypothetical protein
MEHDGHWAIIGSMVPVAPGLSQCLETAPHTMHDYHQWYLHAWAAIRLLASGELL